MQNVLNTVKIHDRSIDPRLESLTRVRSPSPPHPVGRSRGRVEGGPVRTQEGFRPMRTKSLLTLVLPLIALFLPFGPAGAAPAFAPLPPREVGVRWEGLAEARASKLVVYNLSGQPAQARWIRNRPRAGVRPSPWRPMAASRFRPPRSAIKISACAAAQTSWFSRSLRTSTAPPP